MPIAQIPSLIPAIPEIFLALTAMGLLMMGVLHREGESDQETRLARMNSRLSLVVLLLTLLLVVTISSRGPSQTFGGMFLVDDFSIFFKVLVLIASILSIILAQDYLHTQRIARFEYPVLILLSALGMLMMISANDLIALYLGLELQSLALYVIATFQRDDIHSAEAGLKYFVLGALASGLLLYGSSLVYGFAGTTNFDALAAGFSGLHGATPATGVVVGIVFILAGLAFKVSAVPFHMWTPDVYEGSPTPVTAFFSVAPKVAAVALLLRVMIGPFGELLSQWQQIVIFISIASMVLGAFAAIAQKNIKRLMAYSSIGHVGYALIGLAVGNEIGVRGVLIYMTIYLFMNVGVFSCILCMRRREHMVVEISDLAGLSKSNPAIALALAIFMFSMAGIPPLAGFFGKLYIFLAAAEAGLYPIAIIGLLTSVVAAYYYLRIVKVMYFDDVGEPFDRTIGIELRLVMLSTSLIILMFFLYPEPVLSSAEAAANALFAG